MSAEKWLNKANQKLKGHGVKLEMSGKFNNLYMRGMFPNKPKEPPGKTQRRVALRIRGLTVDDFKLAEQIAIEIGLELRRGLFDWSKFGEEFEDPNTPKVKTIADFVEEFRVEKMREVSGDTWRYNYELPMKNLPLTQELTEEIMYLWILEQDPECTTSRRKYIGIARSLLELAGLPTKKIMRLAKEMPTKTVNPRLLPEDSEIESLWIAIEEQSKEWADVYGLLATYGFRPHEIFKLDFGDFPDIRVLPNTKTGERIVPPLYPEWVDRFKLSKDFAVPSNLNWDLEMPNWRLGRKIGNRFRKAGYGDPYNLRHAYARRCLEVGLTSDVSAALMGHGRQVHEESYRAFIRHSIYVDAAKRVIAQATNKRHPD